MSAHLEGDQADAFADAVDRTMADFGEAMELATMAPPKAKAEHAGRLTVLSEAFQRMDNGLREMAVAALGPEMASRFRRDRQ